MSSIEEAIAELNTIAVELDTSGPYVAEKVDKIVRTYAHKIEANAKQIVPVDTGATRESIGTDVTYDRSGPGVSVTAIIGPTTEYAWWLEVGTHRMAPRAFMGPSADRYSGEFVDAVNAAADPLEGRR